MTRREASTCEPSREFQSVLEVIGGVQAARVLHAVARAEAVTAVDLAGLVGLDRSVIERCLRQLEGIGLMERAARSPHPSIWAVRPDAVQRVGLAWISYALGNPDRLSGTAPANPNDCCGAQQ